MQNSGFVKFGDFEKDFSNDVIEVKKPMILKKRVILNI